MGALDTLRAAFGPQVQAEAVLDDTRMGRRITGLDLSQNLAPDQAAALIGALDDWQIISFPDQVAKGVSVVDLERIANHFGAPLPHPSNVDGYKTDGPVTFKSPDTQPRTLVDAAFPGTITSLPGGDTPVAYLVTNLIGSGPDATPVAGGGQHWHTDIEFEPIPLSTSMFLVHRVPTPRDGETWVTNPPREPGFYHPDSSELLSERREALPLNGETAYADTAAAYNALTPERQRELDDVMIRRRLRVGDEGFLIPLVYVNPRNGQKSLHSPVWASRGKRIAPAQVEGMTDDESRHYLDDLEEHCLAPEFRYDHIHRSGDITIWSNFSTLHVAPPTKKVINDPADARLMYRISCKGPTSLSLPRPDADDWLEANITPPYRSSLATV